MAENGSAVAEFVGVDECSYFWETDFPRYGTAEDPLVLALRYNVLVIGQKMNDHHKDECTVNGQRPEYVSSYFAQRSANIIEHVNVSTNDIQICLSDITI